MRRLLPIGACALLATSFGLSAQNGNATLLARFDPSGFTYNDVWGYVSPTGGEYAILGTTNGLFIVDCTDPSNPQQRAFFNGPGSTWRDMRSYRNYVYAVTEGGGGCQIIDMADPDNPVMLGTWGNNFWSSAHNVAIDTATGLMYPCGTFGGTQIVDLSQDPTNPTWLGSYNAAYVHDLHVQDGWAHLGEINSSRYRILDISAAPGWTILGAVPVSSCHNAWPTRDNNFAVTSSERTNGRMTVVDITDKNNPNIVATWGTGSFASIHNVYMRDRVAISAYYSEGLRAVDISDPSNPRQVAGYDTHPASGGFSGAWGCYPFMPSGVVYVSDQTFGLNLIDTPSTTCQFGTGTPGTGPAPSLHTFGAPFYGNSEFAFEVEDAPANSNATLLIGAQTNLNVQGLELLVDLSLPILSVSIPTDSNGYAKFDLPLAQNLPSVQLAAQVLVNDPQGPLGLCATQGLKVDFFDRGGDV